MFMLERLEAKEPIDRKKRRAMSSVNIVQEHLGAEGVKVNIKGFFFVFVAINIFFFVVALARKGEFSFELLMH